MSRLGPSRCWSRYSGEGRGFWVGWFHAGLLLPGPGLPEKRRQPGIATADTAPGPRCHGPAGHHGAGSPAGLRPGGFQGEW